MINDLICRRQFVADTKSAYRDTNRYFTMNTDQSITPILHDSISWKDNISKNVADIKRNLVKKISHNNL